MSLVRGPWRRAASPPKAGTGDRAPLSHPGEETLAAAVSGQLDRPHHLVIMAHLEQCARCREIQAGLAAPGGELLAGISAEEAPPAALWRSIEAALDLPLANARLDPALPIPAAIRAELDGVARPHWWSRLLNGGRIAILLRDPVSRSQLCLGEMQGGRRFPRHLHVGSEQSAVLAGGYADERGTFEAGDYVEYERDSEHGPDTLEGDPCWILFRLEGGVRFRGWRGVVQRLLAGRRAAAGAD